MTSSQGGWPSTVYECPTRLRAVDLHRPDLTFHLPQRPSSTAMPLQQLNDLGPHWFDYAGADTIYHRG